MLSTLRTKKRSLIFCIRSSCTILVASYTTRKMRLEQMQSYRQPQSAVAWIALTRHVNHSLLRPRLCITTIPCRARGKRRLHLIPLLHIRMQDVHLSTERRPSQHLRPVRPVCWASAIKAARTTGEIRVWRTVHLPNLCQSTLACMLDRCRRRLPPLRLEMDRGWHIKVKQDMIPSITTA